LSKDILKMLSSYISEFTVYNKKKNVCLKLSTLENPTFTCFNTNSDGYFPMQAHFYLRPQGHQIWI